MTCAHHPYFLSALRRTKVHAVWGTWKRAVSCLCSVYIEASGTRKWVSESPAAGRKVAKGGGRLLFDMWQKNEKNFHYFITFYSRLLSNMETVQWHRSSLWFIHCLLHGRITQVCSFTTHLRYYFTVLNLHSPLTCRVEQHNVAACTLCNGVIRGRFTLCLRERWANTAGCANCAISLIYTHSWAWCSCKPACMHVCLCHSSVTGDVGGKINHQTSAEVNTWVMRLG